MPLGPGQELGEAFACGENTGGGNKAVWAALLMALDAGNNLDEKGSVWEAVVRRVWK